MAAVGDLPGIFQSLRRVGEQIRHLLGGFDVILAAFVAHPVLILHFFSGLDAQKDIMCRGVLCVGIMHIVGAYQFNPCLLAHSQQLLIHQLLIRNPVILQLQEEISFSENFLIAEGRFFPFLIHSSGQISGHLSCQAGAEGNDPLMVFFQQFQIHSGLVVVALHKSGGNNFHQIAVSRIVLRQQHQVIIPALAGLRLPVEPGTRSHINLTAHDGIDPRLPGRLVKINTAEHHAMIGYGRAVHSQLFHSGYIFFDFIGAVQKTVLCMHMQMCEIHHSVSFLMVCIFCQTSLPEFFIVTKRGCRATQQPPQGTLIHNSRNPAQRRICCL